MLCAAVALALVAQLSLIQGATTDSGTTVKQVKTVGDPVGVTTSSQAFLNVAGAVTTVTIPAGQQGLTLTRFTGEASCFQDPLLSAHCYIRVTINGVPQGNIRFDTARASGGYSSHSSESGDTFGAGTYTVRVQFKVDDSNVIFALGNWRLTVERIQK